MKSLLLSLFILLLQLPLNAQTGQLCASFFKPKYPYTYSVASPERVKSLLDEEIKKKGDFAFNRQIAEEVQRRSDLSNLRLEQDGIIETESVIIGGGIQGSIAANGLKQAFPSKNVLVVDKNPCLGVFNCFGDSFYINSAEYLAARKEDILKLSKNRFHGMPIQPSSFKSVANKSKIIGEEYFVPGKVLGDASNANLVASGADILGGQKIVKVIRRKGDGFKYEMTLESGKVIRANRVIFSTGLGEPVFPVKDPDTLKLLKKESQKKNPKVWLVENYHRRSLSDPGKAADKKIAVCGSGDGGKITVELLLGEAPSAAYKGALSSENLPSEILWYGQKSLDSKTYYAKEWERYHDIGPYFPGGNKENIIKPIDSYLEKVEKLSNGKFKIISGNESQVVDEIIFAAGYRNNVDELLGDFYKYDNELTAVPVKGGDGEIVARQIEDEEIFFVGPVAQNLVKEGGGLGTTASHAGGANSPRIEDLAGKTFKFSQIAP